MKVPGPPNAVVYNVTVDRSRLAWESVSPLFKRASVTLVGEIDSRWCRSYELIAAEAATFARFTLDRDASCVRFTGRSTDNIDSVQGLVDRLELLIELANTRATLDASLERQQSA